MKFYGIQTGIVCATIAAACTSEPIATPVPLAPVIQATTVRANQNNVLSAILTVHVQGADSVAVRYVLVDVALRDSVTPAVRSGGDSTVVAVLGLLPVTRYAMRAIAYWPGGIVVGSRIDFMTDALPDDVPAYSASGSDPSSGFVVFGARNYGVVIDNTGRVVWYRRFENGVGLNFMAEPNGRYVARPPTPDPTDVEPWVELDNIGNITRTLGCALGLQSRPHDLISEPDGGYWLMCDDTRKMDLSGVGGLAAASVTGTAVQHISAAGKLAFQWSPFDHFAITDGNSADRIGANVNWTHGNAIDFDSDGHLLVSFRNLSELTKIDTVSGAVIWRMGGRRNQFTFVDSPPQGFSGQHGVRVSGTVNLTILDNLGVVGESRAERYVVNEATRTAVLATSLGAGRGVVTQIGGSVQNLPSGRTLVSFGTAGRVEEYDATGQIVWRIDGDAGYVFRAQRILSLYSPGVGTAR